MLGGLPRGGAGWEILYVERAKAPPAGATRPGIPIENRLECEWFGDLTLGGDQPQVNRLRRTIQGGFVPSLPDREQKKMTIAAIEDQTVARVIRTLGTVLANVNMFTKPVGLSNASEDSPTESHSQGDASEAEELLCKVVEPFRFPDESPAGAAHRIRAESFPTLYQNVWVAACRRLGEAVALTAAVLVARCRDHWAQRRDAIRNLTSYLGRMLAATNRATVLTQAKAVVANRRKALRAAEVSALPEPEPACDPAQEAPEPPAAVPRPQEPEPASDAVAAPEAVPVPEPDPLSSRRLTAAEIEDEEYEVLRCVRAGPDVVPARIAAAPPETLAAWCSENAMWRSAYDDDHKFVARRLMHLLHSELDRLGLLPPGYRKR